MNTQRRSALFDDDIILFSHLRWKEVLQRPHHIARLLSRHHRVLFVEEPWLIAPRETPRLKPIRINRALTVIRPYLPTYSLSQLLTLLRPVTEEWTTGKPWLWFYYPGFIEALDRLPHDGMIYDCMDELTAFDTGTPLLAKQETRLLKRADIVFAGGKSLYELKRPLNPHTHCFPSAVDYRHFRKALIHPQPEPADIAGLPHPRVGYYGVLDERLDYGLIGRLSRLMPRVSWVFIGPFCKVAESVLPRAANIYHLGAKRYAQLPRYLHALDVAMMPFALNKATTYISPTKTLEYLAGEKPVISTPIRDVVRDYGGLVRIVKTAATFARAVRYFWREPPVKRLKRQQASREIAMAHSWVSTVAEMERLITGRLRSKQSFPGQAPTPPAYIWAEDQ